MNRLFLVASAAFALTFAQPAAATPCEVCDNTIACTDISEVCLGGLPETTSGRCTAPCPNVGAPFGGCPTNYTCVPLTGGQNVCAPRSDDCTNLGNYTPSAPGQPCSTQSCTSNTLCVGGTCSTPCASFGTGGGCAGGQFCGFIGLPTDPFFICGRGIPEGAVCGNGDVCTVGLCLNDGSSTQCYRNCGVGPGSAGCQGGQTCQSVSLTSGETISVCTPPMSGGFPDAGVPDSGVGQPDAAPNFPDAQTSFPDATQTSPDAGPSSNDDARVTNPGDDAATTSGDDASVTNPGDDAAASASDTGGSSRSGGGGSVVRRSSGCTCLTPSAPPSAGVWLALLAPLALFGRRFSGRRTARS